MQIKIINPILEKRASLSTRKRRASDVISILILIFILNALFFSDNNIAPVKEKLRSVKLLSISLLAQSENTISFLGTVSSLQEATLKTESSGTLTRVYKNLGDRVLAGEIIAELENRSERASLLQTEGALEQAKVAFDVARINSSQTSTSLKDIQVQSKNSLSSAYIAMTDAVYNKTDPLFNEPRFQTLSFRPSVPDASLVISIESQRRALEKVLKERSIRNESIPDENILEEITTIKNESEQVKKYLDDISLALSKALPNESFPVALLDTNRNLAQQGRQSISSIISSLVGARTALSSALTEQKLSGVDTITKSTSMLSAEAQVKQAQGVYNQALARYEKTIIRSPVTGSINSFPLKKGDFVNSFNTIAVVSNNGALEIIGYINEEQKDLIKVGDLISIEGKQSEAVVTRIAGGIDPITKKIEVRIGLTSGTSLLTSGQSVRLFTQLSKKETAGVPTIKKELFIPLAAIKMTPDGSFIFTVDGNNKIKGAKVTVGEIRNETIKIESGIGEEISSIVADARGLKEGMEVKIKL